MDRIKEWLNGLYDPDANAAYVCLKHLLEACEKSNEVYPYFDEFVEMLDHTNSYFRTRGILLIAANARWDVDYKLDETIDKLLLHIADEKPITTRQCIKILPQIATYKPDLKACICSALKRANPQMYRSSMQPLVTKDIQNALKIISELD